MHAPTYAPTHAHASKFLKLMLWYTAENELLVQVRLVHIVYCLLFIVYYLLHVYHVQGLQLMLLNTAENELFVKVQLEGEQCKRCCKTKSKKTQRNQVRRKPFKYNLKASSENAVLLQREK